MQDHESQLGARQSSGQNLPHWEGGKRWPKAMLLLQTILGKTDDNRRGRNPIHPRGNAN